GDLSEVQAAPQFGQVLGSHETATNAVSLSPSARSTSSARAARAWLSMFSPAAISAERGSASARLTRIALVSRPTYRCYSSSAGQICDADLVTSNNFHTSSSATRPGRAAD